MAVLYVYTLPAHGLLSVGQRGFGLCSAVGFPVKVRGNKYPCGRTIVVVWRVRQYIVRCTGRFSVVVPGGIFPSGGYERRLCTLVHQVLARGRHVTDRG